MTENAWTTWTLDLSDPLVWGTAALLALLGSLASASGIGGGAFFVSVFLLEDLPLHAAVPLSTAIIFLGSLVNFYTFYKYKNKDTGKSLIDFELAKNIISSALVGTLFGVLFNVLCPPNVLVVVLIIVLLLLSIKTWHSAIVLCRQENRAKRVATGEVGTMMEEEKDEEKDERGADEDDQSPRAVQVVAVRKSVLNGTDSELLPDDEEDEVSPNAPLEGAHPVSSSSEYDLTESARNGTNAVGVPVRSRSSCLSSWKCDLCILLICLVVVVGCGVARHKGNADPSQLKLHPQDGLLLLPIVCGLLSLLKFRATAEKPTSLRFPVMGLLGGLVSGLLGIGGGVIFSPAMVALKVDPAVAVATSACSVLFTSCSTMSQYLLMGRIRLDYALFYGFFGQLGSLLGAKLITQINKRCGRKSVIVMIVGAALTAALVMTVTKAIQNL
eukprot:g26375.t1